MASLPKQLGGQAATKAGYRFLESAQTSYERLMRPHLEQTKAMMQQQKRVLQLFFIGGLLSLYFLRLSISSGAAG